MDPFDVKLLGLPVRVDQPAALACLLAGDVTARLVAELDARAGGQPLDRLAELKALQLLMNLMTSPPSPHEKQWYSSLPGVTLNDGVRSSWNGHRPLR